MKEIRAVSIVFLVAVALLTTSSLNGQRPSDRNHSREQQPARLRKSALSRLEQTQSCKMAKASASRYVPNEILIQLDRDAGSGVKSSIERRILRGVNRAPIGVPRLKTVRAANKEHGELVLAVLPPGKRVKTELSCVRGLRGVAFAQRNWNYTVQQSTSDDSEYINGDLWGMYSDDLPSGVGPPLTTNEYGCQAEKAWAKGDVGSRDIYVAILDQGVQIDHPDLADNIWTNPGESGWDSDEHRKESNGKDDDGDGLCDDVHGWDFYHNDNSVYDGGLGGAEDWHGTHLAGTIGGIGGNARDVVGVNWRVTIIPVKFIGPTSGSSDAAIKAIDYLVRLKEDKGLNIVAINASWIGDGYDPALLDAIKSAANENILFVAAAGNNSSSTDRRALYPACYDTKLKTVSGHGTPGMKYDSVISVAAIKKNGEVAPCSNYGLRTVDLGAPGFAIVSTSPFNKCDFKGGTSMAAAHVTGAAALYASTHQRATAESIKAAILDAARLTRTTSLIGITVTGGRLNVGNF